MATKTITQINRNLTGITYSGMSNSYIEVEVYDDSHSGVSCKTNLAYLKTAITNTYDSALSGLSTTVSTSLINISSLSTALSGEISSTNLDITSLITQVSSEITRSISLTTAISNEISDVTSLTSTISTEISNRINEDTSLTTEISKEISNRISGDTSLTTEINNLSDAIINIIEDRIAGDTSLTTEISNEISNRISGDTSLTSMISTDYLIYETYTGITAPNTYEPLLPITPSAPETKYLNGNKQWANITIGSGGYASNVYPTTLISTFYSGYSQASYINDTGTTEVIISGNSASGIVTGHTYIYDTPLNLSNVDAGIWTISFYLKIDDTNADTKIGWEILTRSSGGTETSHFVVWSPTIENTTYEILRMEYNSPTLVVNPSDHMALRIYFQTTRGTAVNVTYQIGDGYGSYMNTPLNMRHSQLRGKNDEELYQHITTTQLGILTGVTNNITSLSTQISSEISRSTSLTTILSSEISNRTSDITSLTSQVSSEIYRSTSLTTAISSETSARISADMSLATVVLTDATNGLSLYDKSVGLGGQLNESTSIAINNKELSFLLSKNSFVIGSGFDDNVYSFALQSDGKILCGGYFTSYSGVTANKIIRLNSDGSIDNTFITGTGFDNEVYDIILQSDGKILCSGWFTSYSGVTANKIIRLNSDGSIDNSFVIGSGFNSTINIVTLQSDGKILCGGAFTSYSGVTANMIIRLNSDGSIDNTFVTGTGFDTEVYDIALQSDGKILCGGKFTSYSGVTANMIIRLNSNGSIDNTFVTGTGFNIEFNNEVYNIAFQPNGKILCSGKFTSYSGVTANNIIRLNSNGNIDNTFVTGTGFNNEVYDIALQSDGKILCGGLFNLYSGITSNAIIRLNSDGSIDNTFVIGSGFNNVVGTIALQSDGKILCSGQFTTYSGVTANNIIRLNSDGSIDSSISNEIIIKNNLIEYLNDASSYYTDRSLVDKGYISDLISTEVSTRTSQSNTFLKLSGGTLTDGLSGTTIYLTNEIVSANVRKITQITLISGSTTTWNINDSCSAIVYLTGATILSITNAISGDNGTLVVVQGTSGDITFPSVSKYVGGTIPTLTGSNGIDILSFYYDGATYFWNVGKNYS